MTDTRPEGAVIKGKWSRYDCDRMLIDALDSDITIRLHDVICALSVHDEASYGALHGSGGDVALFDYDKGRVASGMMPKVRLVQMMQAMVTGR